MHVMVYCMHAQCIIVVVASHDVCILGVFIEVIFVLCSES